MGIFCVGKSEGVLAPIAVGTRVLCAPPRAGTDPLPVLPEGVRVECSEDRLVPTS